MSTVSKKIAKEILKDALALERLVIDRDQVNSLYSLLNSISKIDTPKKPSTFEVDKILRQIGNLKNEAKSLNKLFHQI